MLGSDLETPECRKNQAEKRFGGVAGKEILFVKRNRLGSKVEIPKSMNMVILVGTMVSLVN